MESSLQKAIRLNGQRRYMLLKAGRAFKKEELQVIEAAERMFAGAREDEQLRDTFIQHAQGKRVPKKRVVMDLYDPPPLSYNSISFKRLRSNL